MDGNEGLIRMERGEGEVAYVRPEWVEEWSGNGWRVDGEPAPQRKPRAKKAD